MLLGRAPSGPTHRQLHRNHEVGNHEVQTVRLEPSFRHAISSHNVLSMAAPCMTKWCVRHAVSSHKVLSMAAPCVTKCRVKKAAPTSPFEPRGHCLHGGSIVQVRVCGAAPARCTQELFSNLDGPRGMNSMPPSARLCQFMPSLVPSLSPWWVPSMVLSLVPNVVPIHERATKRNNDLTIVERLVCWTHHRVRNQFWMLWFIVGP